MSKAGGGPQRSLYRLCLDARVRTARDVDDSRTRAEKLTAEVEYWMQNPPSGCGFYAGLPGDWTLVCPDPDVVPDER